MLTLRKKTVVHRDGSVSSPASQVSSVSEADTLQSKNALGHAHRTATNNEDSVEEVIPVQIHSTPAGEISRAPASLSFACARFDLRDEHDGTITYVSDDEAAKSSVSMLESMGLAGKWQQAGSVKLRIQNSGPPGASVSLRLQRPSGQTLQSSATSLATWGITLE